MINTKNSHVLPARFDDYEISPCRRFPEDGDPGRFYYEVCEPHEADVWTLYGHVPGQGVEAIGDFATSELAEEVYARITGRRFGTDSVMHKLNNVTLTVCDVTGWGVDDCYALNIWLEAYANLLGRDQEEKAVNCVRNALALESSFPTTDVNQWLHVVITLIAYELMLIIGQLKGTGKLEADLKQMRVNFSPNINFAASSFNNCFDQIDFEQERESIIAQAIALIKG